MEETKPKRTVRRAKKAANSPIPSGPIGSANMGGSTCGHSGCETSCKVRYVGPVTNIRDHHIIHAARGVAHVWTAAIVAGLAVVLTGAIAYTAVQAENPNGNSKDAYTLRELAKINSRLNTIEQAVRSR